MDFILYGIFIAILYPFANYFGRTRHIGVEWSLALLASGLIPGLIAIASSPNASEKPTTGSGYTDLGSLIRIIGFASIFIAWNQYQTLPNYLPNKYQLIGMSWIFTIWLFIVGAYLTRLGKGKIVNKEPIKNIIKNIDKIPNVNPLIKKTPSVTNHYYYIVEKNKQVGPITYHELADKKITEHTLVWKRGLENWIKASELRELDDIIAFTPPPIPDESLTNTIDSIIPTLTPPQPTNHEAAPTLNNPEKIELTGKQWVKYLTLKGYLTPQKRQKYFRSEMLFPIGILLKFLHDAIYDGEFNKWGMGEWGDYLFSVISILGLLVWLPWLFVNKFYLDYIINSDFIEIKYGTCFGFSKGSILINVDESFLIYEKDIKISYGNKVVATFGESDLKYWPELLEPFKNIDSNPTLL